MGYLRRQRLIVSVLACAMAAAGSGVASAVEPDDVPWDDIDRVLKENPAAPEPDGAKTSGTATGTTSSQGGTTIGNPLNATGHNAPPVLSGRAPNGRDTLGENPDPEPPVPVASPSSVQQAAPVQSAAPASAASPKAPATIADDPNAGPAPNGGAQVAPAGDATKPSAPPPVESAHAPDPTSAPLYLPLSRHFEARGAFRDYDQVDRDALQKFYTARMNQSLWTTRDGFNDAAKNLIAELKAADDWGLSAADYKIPGLTKIGAGDFGDDDLADAEVRLSLVAMQYAHHARGGRIDEPSVQLSSYLDRKPQVIDRTKFLENLASSAPLSGDYLRSLHPKHEQFEKLRQKLVDLRKNGPGEEFEKIPDGPKLTPGKSHWQIGLVRRRLKIDAPTATPTGKPADENFYDDALVRAVEDFKRKNEIEPVNPSITTALRKAMNADNRVTETTILANMEQWRWMPEELGSTHIFVNIPEFLVRVFKNKAILHEERIVTGKVETQTPIFSDNMRTVVFQPPWHVPESIKINELLPGLRAGGNPIEKQGLVLERNGRKVSAWDVDWDSADIRQYNIFQPPGDANVLGVVKFLFPNKHSVYLHDTPAKRLFNEKVRTFSHGCMRVRNPVQLAEVIMNEDKGWDKARVDELVNSGPEDNNISLDKPLPVHVTYFTAWVTDAGELKTFADVYGHEKRIVLGLEGRWNEIEKNRDHLLPPEDVPIERNVSSSSDDNWYEDRPSRRSGRPRLSYEDAPPPPGYKKSKGSLKGTAFGEFLNNMFGGN